MFARLFRTRPSWRAISHSTHRCYTAPAFISTSDVVSLCSRKPAERDLIFVDVRSPDSFAQGSITGAVNMHDIFTYLLPTSSSADMAAMRAHFGDLLRAADIRCSPSEHVIVYEDGLTKLYGSSCRGYMVLKQMGHPTVSVLEGGYNAFLELSEADRAIVATQRTTVGDVSEVSEGETVGDWMCGHERVLEVVRGERKAHLLDVRDEEEWVGLSSSPYGKDFTPRKGRIPGAKWMEWYRLMSDDGTILPQKEVEALMTGMGIAKDDEVIIYCFKGARASNTLMVLQESGYHRVSNYFASWNEWSRNMDLPIDDTVLQNQN